VITYNINALAEVVLTDYGLKILREKVARFGLFPDVINGKTRTLNTELWNIMYIFGDCLWMANRDIPFVHNNITIHE